MGPPGHSAWGGDVWGRVCLCSEQDQVQDLFICGMWLRHSRGLRDPEDLEPDGSIPAVWLRTSHLPL